MTIVIILFGAAIAVLSGLVGILIASNNRQWKEIERHEANLRILKEWAEQKDIHITAMMVYLKAANSRNACHAPVWYDTKDERFRELLAIAKGRLHDNVNPLWQFGIWQEVTG